MLPENGRCRGVWQDIRATDGGPGVSCSIPCSSRLETGRMGPAQVWPVPVPNAALRSGERPSCKGGGPSPSACSPAAWRRWFSLLDSAKHAAWRAAIVTASFFLGKDFFWLGGRSPKPTATMLGGFLGVFEGFCHFSGHTFARLPG